MDVAPFFDANNKQTYKKQDSPPTKYRPMLENVFAIKTAFICSLLSSLMS